MGRLRELVMFALIQEAGEDTCFRCGRAIESANALAIDHEIAWLDRGTSLLESHKYRFLACGLQFSVAANRCWNTVRPKPASQGRSRGHGLVRWSRGIPARYDVFGRMLHGGTASLAIAKRGCE